MDNFTLNNNNISTRINGVNNVTLAPMLVKNALIGLEYSDFDTCNVNF